MFNLTEITNQKINVQLLAKDNNGQNTELSGMKDENGNTVLRVVDAAPFAYEPSTDQLRVLTEKQSKTKLEEVFSGTIAGATSQLFYVDFQGEDEVWALVSTDQPSWTLRSGTFFNLNGVFDSTFFPKIGSTQSTTHATTAPLMALFMPLGAAGTGAFANPSNLTEAKMHPLSPGDEEFMFQFRNIGATSANVKVSILRVWK